MVYTPLDGELPFLDVSTEDWFYHFVVFMYTHGIMTGMSENPRLFSPKENITRAMVVQALHNIECNPIVYSPHSFTDVLAGAWYYDAVKWAYYEGIVAGFGDGTFRPGDYVTRAHLAIILNNYIGRIDIELPILVVYHGFADSADVRNYAREAVKRFFRALVIINQEGNIFDPQGNVTRAELTAILYRLLAHS